MNWSHPLVENVTPCPKPASKLSTSGSDYSQILHQRCFPRLPVPKAACFGLDDPQIPQGWVFTVPTLLLPINLNGQSTIIKMFHEVFRNVHRNLLEGTNPLVIVTTRLRLGDFTALILIKAFNKIPPWFPRHNPGERKCCLSLENQEAGQRYVIFQRLKSVRS